MEDFRHLSRLSDIQQDRWREAEQARQEANRLPAPRVNLRRVLLSLTVVILGMAAWWGQ